MDDIRRYTLYGVVLLAGLAFVMALVPSAAAQASTASMSLGQGSNTVTVTPFGAPTGSSVSTAMSWQLGTVQPTQSVSITASVTNKPTWLTVAISPTTVLCAPPPSAVAGQQSNNIPCTPGSMNIAFSAVGGTPPARQPSTVEITFTAQKPTASDIELQPASLPLTWTATAEYYSILGFRLSNQFAQVGPTDTATFPLTIQNLGNGNTFISFGVDQVGNDLWQVPVPNPFVVEATQTGAESNEQNIPLQITSARDTRYYDDLGVVTYNINSWFASDSSLTGQSSKISVMAYFNGVYVPGFEMAGVAAALGATAFLLKRRKP